MEFTKPHIIRRKLNELLCNIYDLEEDLELWETRTGQYTGEGIYTGVEENWTGIKVGDRWKPSFHLTKWFRRKVAIPEAYHGRKVQLDINTGGEGLVYVDGQIVSGLSSYSFGSLMNRSKVVLSNSAVAGKIYDVEIEVTLNYGEHSLKLREGIRDLTYTFEKAKLVVVNEELEACWFDINTALEALMVLKNPIAPILSSALLVDEMVAETFESFSRDDYIYSKVANALISSVTCLDFDLGRDKLLDSIPLARKVLAKRLAKINAPGHAFIRFVGQGHLDTAWLWTIRESIRKTVRTISNVLALMDQYPEFTFAFSQPQLFEFLKSHYPKVYEKMKIRIDEGRLELVGNAWVEMDVNVPSGEALIRQLLYGRAFYLKEFGKASSVYFMPDVFGYTWSLPQIIKRSGIKYFFTSKIVHNEVTRFPHSLFNWQGVDGTQVLSYMQRLNYNGNYNPKNIDTLYKRFDEKHISENLMMTYGFGDGGGGPVYEMIETGKRLKSFPGLQRTDFGTAHDFFADNEAIREELPIWNDEMYFEMHRGTLTAQARTKKQNRELELLYRQAEILSTIAMIEGDFESPNAELLPGYKRLLTNQFHDILPGSSIALVYDEIEEDYAFVRKTGSDVVGKALQVLQENIPGESGDIIVFNPLSWMHRALVQIESGLEYLAVRNKTTGEVSYCDKIVKHGIPYLCFEAEVPSLGYAIYEKNPVIDDAKEPDAVIGSVAIEGEMYLLENTFLKVELNKDGEIISVFDKEVCRQVLNAPSNILAIYEDKPADHDAWDIDLEYRNKKWPTKTIALPEFVYNSARLGIIRVKRKFNKSIFTQDIILRGNSRRIDFETHVDWQECNKLLKAEFDLDIHANKATYEIQFATIERSTYGNTAQERAKFEVCGHRFADMSESEYGVALLNDSKYGYDAERNKLRLTLLTASVFPDPKADVGMQCFTYSLLPHIGGWQKAKVVNAGYELNVPLIGIQRNDNVVNQTVGKSSDIWSSKSLLVSSKENVIIDTVKAAEDGCGFIIRVYEATGNKTNTAITTGFDVVEILECNLMEENEQKISNKERTFDFIIKPYEIKTFRLIV